MGYIIKFNYLNGHGHMALDVDVLVLEQPQVKQKKLIKLIKGNATEEELQHIIDHCKEEAVWKANASQEYQKKADDFERQAEERGEKKSEAYKSLHRKQGYHSGIAKKYAKEADRYERFKKMCEEEAIR